MRRIFRPIFLTLVIYVAPLAQAADLHQRINDLNDRSVQSLGISLPALYFLAGAELGSYLHLGHLKSTGRMQYVEELERAGYVSVQYVDDFPTGAGSTATYITIYPSTSGDEILMALTHIEHNKAKQEGTP